MQSAIRQHSRTILYLLLGISLVICVIQLYRNNTLNPQQILCNIMDTQHPDSSCGDNSLTCIPDAATHGKTVPHLRFLCLPTARVTTDMTVTEARVNMFSYLRPTVKCYSIARYGGYGCCQVCTAGPFNPQPNNCLIYSFGIGNVWKFDDHSRDKVKCEVHSFDPTMGLKDHRRPNGVMFHNLGLSGSNEVNKEGWALKTLCTIMRELGHEGKTIDVLKFDIEYSEWGALEAMKREGCLKHVRQMVFEIHMWTDENPFRTSLLPKFGFPLKKRREETVQDYAMYYQRLRDLQDTGFRSWLFDCFDYSCYKPSDQPNILYCPQCNVGYINTNFI